MHFSDNYLYFRSLNTDGTDTSSEYVYFIDKVQEKLTVKPAFTRTSITKKESESFIETLLLEVPPKLLAFTNYKVDSDKILAFGKQDLGTL